MNAHTQQALESPRENQPSVQEHQEKECSRSSFLRGVLGSLALLTVPGVARAWMDGKWSQREDIGDGIKALIKTYSDTTPYPHKFSDALVKLHLRDIDFAASKGLDKEFADHYVLTLGVPIARHVKPAIEKLGKDCFLWGIFERTSCSYQLYEHIDVKKGQRSFPCPYKPILDQILDKDVTYTITWKDVCEKWCSRIWNGFANTAGVKIKIKTGKTCKVKVV